MTERLTRTVLALQMALSGRDPRRIESPESRAAAVLIPLWDSGERVEVVFTKRTSHLAHHAGQISFPGGAADPDDNGLSFTALRETCEEIGACENSVQVVARLDQVVTVTNFLVTPYLGMIEEQADFQPNPKEVERLVIVPLEKVLDQASYRPTEIVWQGISFNQEALEHRGDLIWGATARILQNLLHTLGDEAHSVVNASLAKA